MDYEDLIINAKMEKLMLKVSRQDSKLLARAKKRKEKVDKLFNGGDFANASSIYEDIISYVVENMPLDIDLYIDAHNFIVSLQLKIAACQLNLGNFNQVISKCTHVLTLDLKSVEAYHMRAKAYVNVKDLESAKCDFEKVLEIDPENEEIKLEIVKLEEKMMEKEEVIE